MENKEFKLLTEYFAAWSWQIISLILLCSCAIIISIGIPNISIVISAVLFFIFVITQYIAIKRRAELFNE